MRKILLAVACVAVVMACSTAPARAQSVTLTPFCDDTTIGGPGSGFLVSAPSTSFITLHFITAGLGEFNVSPEVDLVAAGFPPGIGATTLEVYEDPNHNLRVDPGERLLETQSHEDPCGPPPPTTKDQCKNGGWRQFGFQNQGRCIRFVKHGPKK